MFDIALVVLIAYAVAFSVAVVARRYTVLTGVRAGRFYFLSLPVAYGVINPAVPIWVIAVTNVLGLADLLWLLRRSRDQNAVSKQAQE